ncbi:hypothetical protein J2X83_005821 [Brevibacillus nitrificans]|nr:hypothetical protein [Brevibacillus nitrificans]
MALDRFAGLSNHGRIVPVPMQQIGIGFERSQWCFKFMADVVDELLLREDARLDGLTHLPYALAKLSQLILTNESRSAAVIPHANPVCFGF